MPKKAFVPHGHTSSRPTVPGDGDASRTLIERAYTQLRDDIVEGRLPPGEKLRVEHLRVHYGVGAGTLREAITRLVSDALVEAEGQRGFHVTPIALQDLVDITNLRLHIEIEALRLSIRHGDAGWRDQLQQAFDEMSGFEQPIRADCRQRWELLNTRFHESLIAAGASAWTLRVLRLLGRHSERYRRLAIGIPGSTRDVHAEHAEIFNAAIRGQEARAALALEAHIRATPDLLRASWERVGAPVIAAQPIAVAPRPLAQRLSGTVSSGAAS